MSKQRQASGPIVLLNPTRLASAIAASILKHSTTAPLSSPRYPALKFESLLHKKESEDTHWLPRVGHIGDEGTAFKVRLVVSYATPASHTPPRPRLHRYEADYAPS